MTVRYIIIPIIIVHNDCDFHSGGVAFILSSWVKYLAWSNLCEGLMEFPWIEMFPKSKQSTACYFVVLCLVMWMLIFWSHLVHRPNYCCQLWLVDLVCAPSRVAEHKFCSMLMTVLMIQQYFLCDHHLIVSHFCSGGMHYILMPPPILAYCFQKF